MPGGRGGASALSRPSSAGFHGGRSGGLTRSGSVPQWLPRRSDGGVVRPSWMSRHAMLAYQPDAPPPTPPPPFHSVGAGLPRGGRVALSRGGSAARFELSPTQQQHSHDDSDDSPPRPRRQHLGKQLASTATSARPGSAGPQ